MVIVQRVFTTENSTGFTATLTATERIANSSIAVCKTTVFHEHILTKSLEYFPQRSRTDY